MFDDSFVSGCAREGDLEGMVRPRKGRGNGMQLRVIGLGAMMGDELVERAVMRHWVATRYHWGMGMCDGQIGTRK